MLTTKMKEGLQNRIEIKNFSADLIAEMLEYFYTTNLRVLWGKSSNYCSCSKHFIKYINLRFLLNLLSILSGKYSKHVDKHC